MARPTNTQFAVAVHVLTYLAATAHGLPVTSDELSETIGVTPVHVRRVLGPLRVAGLVRSVAGAHGGWQLLADPAQVTLAEVWRLVHGEAPVLALAAPDPTCDAGRRVQSALADLERTIAHTISQTLASCTVDGVLAASADLGS